jgi:hypothetical protein
VSSPVHESADQQEDRDRGAGNPEGPGRRAGLTVCLAVLDALELGSAKTRIRPQVTLVTVAPTR